MGVFIADTQFNNLLSSYDAKWIDKHAIKSWDGFMYSIVENPLEFLVYHYDVLDDEKFDELIAMINLNLWIKDKKLLIDKLHSIKTLSKEALSQEIGDFYFAKQAFGKCLEYYLPILNHDYNIKGKVELDRIYCHIGQILLSIGEVEEGLKLLDYAYQLNESFKIRLKLIKYKVEFNLVEDFTVVEEFVKSILNIPTEDENLSFLLWYYNYIGDYESSITSYMQLEDINLRFNLVDYYMVYMLESNQYIAMESFLKPLKDYDLSRYQFELIQVYMDLDRYDEAMEALEKHKEILSPNNQYYILKSKCNLGLKRIIESVTAINHIQFESLCEADLESYYIQLAKLSKYSKDFSKEHIYKQKLVRFWQAKYRNIYSGILYNTKWKVNK